MTLLYHLILLFRRIKIALARTKEPPEYNLLEIDIKLPVKEITKKLWEYNYYYNDLSITYIGQVATWRRLVGLDYQIHLRLYKNGLVTGHFEVSTRHQSSHLLGASFRPLLCEEKNIILNMFKNVCGVENIKAVYLW